MNKRTAKIEALYFSAEILQTTIIDNMDAGTGSQDDEDKIKEQMSRIAESLLDRADKMHKRNNG